MIPNYNGRHLLEENLPHLYSCLSGEQIDHEIIIADDNSEDDSIPFLKKNFHNVIIVKGDTNLGFSGNINRGIKIASKSLVFLLNTDVKITEEYFRSYLKFFDKEDTFGVSGKVLSPTGEIQDTAKYPEIFRLKIKGTINYEVSSCDESYLIPSFFLSGGSSLIDKNKLQELGGFDEIYNPYYGEDIDLSIRAWRSGYKCYYNPEATCYHNASSTISQEKRTNVKVITRRNRFILHHIHLNTERLALWILANWVKLILRALIGDKKFTKSFIEYLKLLPEIKKRRLDEKLFHKTLFEVRDEILTSLKNQNLTWVNKDLTHALPDVPKGIWKSR